MCVCVCACVRGERHTNHFNFTLNRIASIKKLPENILPKDMKATVNLYFLELRKVIG